MSDLLHFNHTIQNTLNSQINTAVAVIIEHTFVYVISGSLTINGENDEYNIQSDNYCIIKRDSVVKFTKDLLTGDELSLIEIQLGSIFLKTFSGEYDYKAKRKLNDDTIINLKSDSLFQKYLESRIPYEKLKGKERDNLLILKNKELVLLLLNIYPELQHVLFNFDEPQKVDLEDYMNRYYKYNLSLSQFGYLTGRSLTSFKRDFEKHFNKAPGRWLLDKRLNQARILIEKEGKKPSEVYLEVGFEDLSHFSFAFKKAFGSSPKKLLKGIETS